ncbi:hypothetical protein JB92DRAFT_2828603 [Gautieria morchelliformis]|nr:hypothetical protein JB92DRAFT_2828603 [Gautieria morchelliformis]
MPSNTTTVTDPAEQAAAFAALWIAVVGRNTTVYLTLAGFTILVYDHLLLLGEEIRVIWGARHGWEKTLFLVNKYMVIAYNVAIIYLLTNLSSSNPTTSSCKGWVSMVVMVNIAALATNNIFVVYRVYALWGHSRRILIMLASAFTIVYGCVFTVGIAGDVTYSAILSMCVLTQRPKLTIVAYAFPILFDIYLFALTIINALDRPRDMQTTLVNQLYRDGAVYFVITLALRLFNIVIISTAHLAYTLLGVFRVERPMETSRQGRFARYGHQTIMMTQFPKQWPNIAGPVPEGFYISVRKEMTRS